MQVPGCTAGFAWPVVHAFGASSCWLWQVVQAPCLAAAISGCAAWQVAHGLTSAFAKLCGVWHCVHARWPVVIAAVVTWRGPGRVLWQLAQCASAPRAPSCMLWQSRQPCRPA